MHAWPEGSQLISMLLLLSSSLFVVRMTTKQEESFGQPTSLVACSRASATLPGVIHLRQTNMLQLQSDNSCQRRLTDAQGTLPALHTSYQ